MVHLPDAFFISHFWKHQLVDHGRQYLFLVVVGFIGAFGFIRLSTRLMRSPRVPWWPGSVVSQSGLHLHHLVFGITMMMAAGVISFSLLGTGWWYEVCAVVFGIGMGLTIDEFALWIYLDDVYWLREGRSSIDASVIALGFMGLILLGGFSVDFGASTPLSVLATIVYVIALLALAIICFLKQRVYHGAIGLLVPPIAIYGSMRIAKPSSPWARRRYGDRRPGKQAKAERRFRPDRATRRVKERVRDTIGGVPAEEYQARASQQEPPTEMPPEPPQPPRGSELR